MKPKKIGILIENNYQELEFWYPYLRLKEAGYEVMAIGPEKRSYKSQLGYEAMANIAACDVMHQHFNALVIPGGYAPDLMRVCEPMLELVKNTHDQGGVIAAICHAIWVPISAGIVSGRQATCYHTVKDDLKNAGGLFVDQSVVVDGNLITSRKPDDLPDFFREIMLKLC